MNIVEHLSLAHLKHHRLITQLTLTQKGKDYKLKRFLISFNDLKCKNKAAIPKISLNHLFY